MKSSQHNITTATFKENLDSFKVRKNSSKQIESSHLLNFKTKKVK